MVTFSAATLFSQSKKEQEVAQVVQTLRQAMLDGDSITLNRITDDKLSYGHSNGLMENQQRFIYSLSSGESDFETMEISNQSIVVRKKTAVVRHNLAGTIKVDGKAGSVKLAVLLVWHKHKKQWKLLARQAVKI